MKKITDWVEYNKYLIYEKENIDDIKKTYIYKLQQKLSNARRELRYYKKENAHLNDLLNNSLQEYDKIIQEKE